MFVKPRLVDRPNYPGRVSRNSSRARVQPFRLVIADDQLDTRVFEQLLGRSMAEGGETKVRTLDTALGLWRGDALMDVRYESFAQGEIRRLEELHVLALEELVSAKLELGAPASVVPQLLAR